MQKKLIIKYTSTGEYFTGNYRSFWSRDISNAEEFNNEYEFMSVFNRYEGAFDNPFEGKYSFEVVTILIK